MAMPHNWELSTPKVLRSQRVLPAGSLEPVGPKSSIELVGCALCFASVKGLGSTVSHQHGTS